MFATTTWHTRIHWHGGEYNDTGGSHAYGMVEAMSHAQANTHTHTCKCIIHYILIHAQRSHVLYMDARVAVWFIQTESGENELDSVKKAGRRTHWTRFVTSERWTYCERLGSIVLWFYTNHIAAKIGSSSQLLVGKIFSYEHKISNSFNMPPNFHLYPSNSPQRPSQLHAL